MAFKDMREWIQKLEEEGELIRVKAEVDWRGELGAITRKALTNREPAILFENIKDYQSGRCTKLFQGGLATPGRVALMLGLPKNTRRREMVDIVRKAFKARIPPVTVDNGPVKENIVKDNINLYEFPVPKWHPLDGGRYINTWCGVVTKDPETGWVNVGLYRGMIVDRDKIGVLLVPSQHWGIHFSKYARMGKPMPVAVVYGWDPTMCFAAGSMLPTEVSEWDVIGALRGEPAELVKCETVDLQVPATAEIVVEGYISPDPKTYQMEGPFGEYAGFYAGQPGKRPVIQVTCITHRDDPIYRGALEGAGPGMPNEDSGIYAIACRALMFNILEAAGIPGIVDVKPGPINIVKIRQTYQGQARQIAAALWAVPASEFMFKNVMVVNEDIDIYNPMMVDWAFCYRVNPKEDLVVFPGTRGGLLDPSMPSKYRDELVYGSGKWNRLLIDATWDMGNRDDWFGQETPPLSIDLDPEDEKLVEKRWKEYGFTSELGQAGNRK